MSSYRGVRIESALHSRYFFQLMMRISLPTRDEDDVEFPVKQAPRKSTEQWLKAETWQRRTSMVSIDVKAAGQNSF